MKDKAKVCNMNKVLSPGEVIFLKGIENLEQELFIFSIFCYKYGVRLEKRVFLDHYQSADYFGSMTEISIDQFKKLLGLN